MIHTVTIPSHARRLAWRTAVLSLVALCLFAGNVAAAGAIQDDGKMFSQSAQTDFANRSAQIERDTGKSVVVRTVASLNGKDISAQADAAFAQLNVNGVLIYLAKNEKKSTIKVGTTTRQAISLQEEGQIRDGLDASFTRGDFDGGLLSTTDRIGRDLRAVFTRHNCQSWHVKPACSDHDEWRTASNRWCWPRRNSRHPLSHWRNHRRGAVHHAAQ